MILLGVPQEPRALARRSHRTRERREYKRKESESHCAHEIRLDAHFH